MKRSILSWLMMMAFAMGQENPSAKPPDFTPAFKQLAALGMPPLDGTAKWAKLPDRMSGGFSDYRLREVLGSLKGNGWLITGTDGKLRILPATHTEITPLDAEEKRGASKPPAEVDIEKDLEKILKALEKKKAENSRFSGLYEVDLGGSLLLLATQLHQTGRPHLANKLTAAVFDTWPLRETVVDSAITTLADREFQKLTDRFFMTVDWAAYHADLTAIRKKFPRGWPTGQALNLLLPQLAKRVAGEKPAPPALPGVDLDQRALDAIARLTEKPQPNAQDASDEEILKRHGIRISEIPASQRAEILRSLRSMQMGGDGEGLSTSPYWILEEKDKEDKSSQDESPIAPLLALKMDALPALAAMLGDPYLTPYPKPDSHGYYSSFSPSESEAEKIEKAYQSMRRPASRGDIARMLLEHAVPNQENNNDDLDTDELRERVLDFWKLHRKSTPGDLAAAFLQEGDSSQRRMAARQLTSSSDPKHHRIFEEHILGSDNPLSEYDLVKTYLGTRKAAAKPFCESYAKLVREQVKSMDKDQLPWEARESGGVEKMLKNLESFVGGKSYRSMAKDIAKGEAKDADAAIRALVEVMQSEPYTKQLYALLEGAVAAENPEIRAGFLQYVHRIENEEDTEEDVEGESPGGQTKPPTLRKLPDAEIKVWRKLLADDRVAKMTDPYRGENRKEMLSEAAAGALCGSVAPSLLRDIYQASLVLNTPIGELVIKHAEAILDGKPLPTLPDATKVSKERLTAIVAETAAKKDMAIIDHLNSLTPDERAAWLEWWSKPENPALPDSVRDLQFTVTDVTKPSDPEKAESAAAKLIRPGFKLTADSIPKLIETLAPEAEKYSRCVIILGPRQGPGLGVQSSTFEMPTKQADGKDAEDEAALDSRRRSLAIARNTFSEVMEGLKKTTSASAAVSLKLSTYSDRSTRSNSVWLIENGKATLAPTHQSEDNEENPSLTSAIQALTESKERQQLQVVITILSRTDAEKIREAVSKAVDVETIDGLPPEFLTPIE